MNPSPDIETFDLELPHGIRLACRSAGDPSLPTLMFLHGFPEAAFVWDEVMGLLADRFRCIAPNLRGYAGSSAPAGVESYRPKLLVADIAAAIESCGAPLAALVAHDWGGALAWNLAATRPTLLRRLVSINSPHPALFLRELRHNPDQQRASDYMGWLCRPDAAAQLSANEYERLFGMLGRFADGTQAVPAWLDDVQRQRYREAWSAGLEGPLNYYRASPLRPDGHGRQELAALTLPREITRVLVPTLVIWGERDAALRPGLLEGLDAHVDLLTVQRVRQATHWIVHEEPALVARSIAGFVARDDASGERPAA